MQRNRVTLGIENDCKATHWGRERLELYAHALRAYLFHHLIDILDFEGDAPSGFRAGCPSLLDVREGEGYTAEIVFDPLKLTRLTPRQPETERVLIKPTGSRHIGHGIHGKCDMRDHDETPDC